MHKLKYVIDIDGTICTQVSPYDMASPLPDRIAKVNDIYDAGHTIWFYTARGTETGIDWREVTEKQLADWGVKYHELHFGKPSADVYIDDRATNVEDW